MRRFMFASALSLCLAGWSHGQVYRSGFVGTTMRSTITTGTHGTVYQPILRQPGLSRYSTRARTPHVDATYAYSRGFNRQSEFGAISPYESLVYGSPYYEARRPTVLTRPGAQPATEYTRADLATRYRLKALRPDLFVWSPVVEKPSRSRSTEALAKAKKEAAKQEEALSAVSAKEKASKNAEPAPTKLPESKEPVNSTPRRLDAPNQPKDAAPSSSEPTPPSEQGKPTKPTVTELTPKSVDQSKPSRLGQPAAHQPDEITERLVPVPNR